MILYIALATVVVVLVSDTSIRMLRLGSKTESMAELQYSGDKVLTMLGQAAAGAYAVDAPATGTASSSLTLRLYEAANDPTVFRQLNNVIYYKAGDDDFMALHSDQVAANIEFIALESNDQVDLVRVSLTLSAAAEGFGTFQSPVVFETTLGLNHTP